MSMIPTWVRGPACALALALTSAVAEAGETPGTLVCNPCRRCYDPCERVGPVRRVLRKVFLRPCPPPCPPVIVAPPTAPPVFLPPPVPAPVPVPVPGPAPVRLE